MIPIWLSLTNFRSWADGAVDFDRDPALVITGPKGVGKTSILDGMFWALYGESRNPRQEELIRAGERECRVAFTFEHDAATYQVSRAYRMNAASKGGTTILTLSRNGGEDLTGATVAETAKRIRDLVGPYDVLAMTAFVRQFEARGFMAAKPAVRRELFASMLAIDERWNVWEADAKAKAKEARDEEVHITSTVRVHEAVAVTLNERLDAWRRAQAEQAKLEAEVEEKRALYETTMARAREAANVKTEAALLTKQVGDIEGQIQTARTQAKMAVERLTRLTSILGRKDVIEQAEQDFVQAEQEYRRDVGAYDQNFAAWARRREIHGELIQQGQKAVDSLQVVIDRKATLERELAALSLPTCPTCQQPLLTAESRGAIDRETKKRRDELAAMPGDLPAKMEASKRHLGKVDVAFTEVPPKSPTAPKMPADAKDLPLLRAAEKNIGQEQQFAEQIESQLREWSKRLAEVQSRRDGLADALRTADDASRQAMTAGLEATEAIKKRDAAANATATAQVGLWAAEKATEDVAVLRKSLALCQGRAEIYEAIVEGCGPRGVRQLIADQAIQEAQDEANRHIAKLEPGYSVLFSTQSESGREVFDVRVMTPYGLYSYEALSGGQSVTVALGVRIGLAHIVARAHGMNRLPVMVFDEPFDGQDALGRQAVVRSLMYLTEVVGKVIVISHDAALLESFGSHLRLELFEGSVRVAA